MLPRNWWPLPAGQRLAQAQLALAGIIIQVGRNLSAVPAVQPALRQGHSLALRAAAALEAGAPAGAHRPGVLAAAQPMRASLVPMLCK